MKAISFNSGWAYAPGTGADLFNQGNAPALIPVTLPHDAIIHEKRDPAAPSGGAKAFFPDGVYHYVKKFDAPADWADKCVKLEFEGVYMNAMVFLNGDFAGQCPHGYSDFTLDLNDLLKFGEENTLKVTLYTGEDSRWYSGAGIYRDVKLYVGDQLHLAKDGIRLTTVSANSAVAAVAANITVENKGFSARDVKVLIDLIDADGNVACHDFQKLHITGGASETLHPRLYVKNPRLWSLDEPNLYTVKACILEGDNVIDESEIPTFGIRLLTLDNVNGLAINGQTVKLYGGCIHHDNGVLGAATIERAEERRVQILKSAGYNAIRMAHHPISKALLRACDRYGMAVMDELGDMWYQSKRDQDYSHTFGFRWEEDIRAMVAKDYNHPSVVMYSMGNEIPESGKAAGARIYRRLADLTRSLDSTRYITAGLNNLVGNDAVMGQLMGASQATSAEAVNAEMADPMGMMGKLSMHPAVVESTSESYEALDICGYNYAADRYLHDEKLFTNRISVGSETFPKDLAYNWNLVKNNASVIGDFSWTSWDYLGEAGIGQDSYKNGPRSFGGAYPWLTAYDADFDITGRKTPQGYYREIVVRHRTEPYLAVQDPAHYKDEPMTTGWGWPGTVSSWNLPGFEGKPVRVDVYGIGDEAELLINGESLGRKAIPQESAGQTVAYRVIFDAIYQPGKAEAVIYRDGRETGRFAVETAGEASALLVTADRSEIRNDDADLAYIDIDLADAEGCRNPGAEAKVNVEVEGAGVLQGLGSGAPCTEEPFYETSCTTYYGHALAVIRPTGKGEIKVTVSAEGFKPVTVTVKAE
ncbi:MAG: DUF4982 domain-containing protein [Lachnospiraceae bacterium]|nr:DUF4982 domain-containing protein [Lachnospiraceae bacterium]